MIQLARPIIGEAEISAVRRVLSSGRLAAGPEIAAFESEFAETVGTAHAIAVSSGTTALELALRAVGIGAGDEVIVPSFTFVATANAVRMCAAMPIFADIDPVSFCIAPDHVASLITPRTAAVIAVHLYGHPADVFQLASLCARHGLVLIEDAAQALGATLDGRSVGSLGNVAAFSFYPTKNITTGEGGMVTTDDGVVADRVTLLRSHGARRRDEHELIGTNARMTEMAAAIGRIQLGHLPQWIRQRRLHAGLLSQGLPAEVGVPIVLPNAGHAFHQYTIRCRNRAAMRDALDCGGIGYGVYYETPCHRQKPYLEDGADLPESDRAALEVLSIPVRPDLRPAEIERIVDAVTEGAAQS